jgi:hypothetical protein
VTDVNLAPDDATVIYSASAVKSVLRRFFDSPFDALPR